MRPSDNIKKNELKPWRTLRFCIPPEQNAAFAQAWELARYRRDRTICTGSPVSSSTHRWDDRATRNPSILGESESKYIVDFYCPAAQLVIEIDGGQHYTEKGQAQDYERDAFLKDMGLSVLRFSNLDALGNIDGVVAEILRHLEKELGERKTKSP